MLEIYWKAICTVAMHLFLTIKRYERIHALINCYVSTMNIIFYHIMLKNIRCKRNEDNAINCMHIQKNLKKLIWEVTIQINERFFKVKSESKQYTVLYNGIFGVVYSPHYLFFSWKNEVLTQVITCESMQSCLLSYVID